MTDVKQELPLITDERNALCRLWTIPTIGNMRPTTADELERAGFCRTEERDAAIKRAETAEFDAKAWKDCEAVAHQQNDELRALVTRMSPDALRALDNGAPLPESGWFEERCGGRLHVFDVVTQDHLAENEKLTEQLTTVKAQLDLANMLAKKCAATMAENEKLRGELANARVDIELQRSSAKTFQGLLAAAERRESSIAEKTAREQREACLLRLKRWGDNDAGLPQSIDDVIGQTPLVTDAPSKPYREHARILGQLGMYAIRTDKSADAIAREIASWPKETDTGDVKCGRCKRPLNCHLWLGGTEPKYCDAFGRFVFDPAPPPPESPAAWQRCCVTGKVLEPGMWVASESFPGPRRIKLIHDGIHLHEHYGSSYWSNGRGGQSHGSAVIPGSPHLRIVDPPESPAEPRCKHGAPNCGGHDD